MKIIAGHPHTPRVPPDQFKLVPLRNGSHAVYSTHYDEKMHPGLGPAQEAELLYVRQLKIRERLQNHSGEFVIWDIGLGAAANALTLLRLTRDLPCPLRIVSFDDTSGPFEFALQHTAQLDYFQGYEATAQEFLAEKQIQFTDGSRTVNWQFHLADFPSWLARSETDSSTSSHNEPLNAPHTKSPPSLPQSGGEGRGEEAISSSCFNKVAAPAPHAIFFDAFSPAKNPAMWTLPLFTNLARSLDRARPCNLTTYSRSTMFRVTLLLAGFFVGRGVATGLKEETTVAANTLTLLDDPLDQRWLQRAQKSDSAEPLHEPTYRRAPLSPETWEKLRKHQQFNL